MADQQFDILIKFGLDPAKAREAVNEIKKIEAQTVKATDATVKQTAVNKEAEKVNIKVSESVRDQMNPALAHATEAMEAGTLTTGRFNRAKQAATKAVQGLSAQFPALAQAARFALHPATLLVGGLSLAIANFKRRNDEAVESFGGFALPELTEDVTARFERIASAAEKISTSAPGIASAFSVFEKNQAITNAFAKGAGIAGDDSETMAQAAREAAERSEFEANRLRGISGNINPNNAAAGDLSKLLPDLQAQRAKIMERLNLATETQNAGFFDPVNLKFMARFGLTPPMGIMNREQEALSSVDAQIASIMGVGRRRGERLGAAAGADSATAQAASFYERAAGFGAAGASLSGKNFSQAGNAMGAAGASGDLMGLIRAAGDLAKEVNTARQRTEAALRDQANANRVSDQQQ
jgi:hypothetical protein